LKRATTVPFPDMKEGARYWLARLQEVQSFPDDKRQLLDMNLLNLRNHILANTGNIREVLKSGCNLNNIEADLWSLVQSMRTTHGWTNDHVVKIINTPLNDMVPIGYQSPLMLSGNEIPFSEYPGQG